MQLVGYVIDHLAHAEKHGSCSSWEENNKENRSDSLTLVQSEYTIVVSVSMVRSRKTLTMPNIPKRK